MRENCYAHPCGFCGAEIKASSQCSGCGVWWSHRNFHFPGANLGRKNRGPEFFSTWDKYPAGTHIWRTEWNGFDEDDRQAVETYGAEYEGYFLGERFHRSVPYEVGDDEKVWEELADRVTAAVAATVAATAVVAEPATSGPENIVVSE